MIKSRRMEEEGLPPAWGREKLVGLARDAARVFLYWELSPSKVAELSRVAGGALPQIHLVYEETRKPALETPCSLEAGSAWVAALPGTAYYAELGLAEFGRPFRVLLRSQPFRTPWGTELRDRERPRLELPPELRRFAPPER